MYTKAEIVEKIREIAKQKNTSLTDIEKNLNWSNGRIGKWKSAKKYPPKQDLELVANELKIPVEIITGEQKEKAPSKAGEGDHAIDYVDDELREYLDELRNRSEMRLLFSTTKNATKAQIEAIVKMVEEMQNDK